LNWFTRIFGRAHSRASEDEKKLIRYLLAGDDKRHSQLAEQLGYAPARRASSGPGGYSVSPEYTNERLSFALEASRIESPWVVVPDLVSGQDLEFRVSVVRGGFLNALEGRTRNGEPWPERWSPDLSKPLSPDQYLQLPSAAAVEEQRAQARAELERWLGRAVPQALDTFPPASEAQISTREMGLGGHFPKSLREFFLISDGLESTDLRFMGHADAYNVDSPYIPALLVAWDSDDRDDFVVVVSLDGTDEAVYRLDVHEDVPKPEIIGEDVRRYLARRIPA
jgi:hypothetical protein